MLNARHSSAALRIEIEDTLSKRVPRALTPSIKTEPERVACGIRALDESLRGGVPVGAITELVGAECSGRTTMALAYVAAGVQSGNVAAWVDVDDTLDPESAVGSGVDCARLLWVRCGQETGRRAETQAAASGQAQNTSTWLGGQPGQPVPPGGGGSPHPRSEGRGMPQAISDLLHAQPRSAALPARRRDKSIGTPGVPNRPLPPAGAYDREEQVPTDRLPPRRGDQVGRVASAPRCAEPVPCRSREERSAAPAHQPSWPMAQEQAVRQAAQPWQSPWTRLDQALRATDLLLQSGGFGLIVFDLGSTPAEMAWRIPLATWFRYRAACDRTRTSLLLLTRHPCARSSAELIVRMDTARMEAQGGVLTGMSFRSEVERQRFQRAASNVIPMRKPPQSERPGAWRGRAAWAI